MRLHHFAGAGDRCEHVGDRGFVCRLEAGNPIHNVEVDPEKVLERRMLGSRRDYRDIELGNPTLRDQGV